MRLIRNFDLSKKVNTAGEKWLYDNKIKLAHICSQNIGTLKRIGRLPVVNGMIRILDVCKKTACEHVYSLDEDKISAGLREAERSGAYLAVSELYCMKNMLLCVAFDAVSDELEGRKKDVCEHAVKMIYALDNIDFQGVFEAVSRVESVLRLDPSGAYGDCDRATKELYLRSLSKTAKRMKIGEYELAERYLEAAERCSGRKNHVGYHILNDLRKNKARMFYCLIDVLPLLVILPLFAFAYNLRNVLAIVAVAFTCLPIRRLAKCLFETFAAKHFEMRSVPKMEIQSIPNEAKTILTYTVSLSGKTNDKQLFDKLSIYAHAYNDPNLYFAVLADLPDSESENDERDVKIIGYAKERISEIYRDNSRVSFFCRRRSFSESERKYIGNERKRGAQEEFVRYLSGDMASLTVFGNETLTGVKYMLALDADTEIMYGDILRLVAAAVHPCNEPEFASYAGRESVTDGYGIFVPQAVMSLKNASRRNRYTILKNAFEGRGPYECGSFSLYTALTGEGVYCGKGLININAYKRVLSGTFPHEKILSHDIAEGAFLRAASVGDAAVYDSPPSSLLSERKRLHRWIRGDVQSLVFTKKYLYDSYGERYPNPLTRSSRCLLKEAVYEHLTAAVRFPAEVFALLSGGWVGMLLWAVSVSDRIYEACMRFFALLKLERRKFASGYPDFTSAVLFGSFLDCMSLADMSVLSADAIFRARFRMKISHRGLLEWTASAVSDAQKDRRFEYFNALKTSAVLGVLSIILSLFTYGASAPILFLNGISRVIYPFYMKKLNVNVNTELRKSGAEFVREDVSLMWRFFSDNVSEKYHFLPPDNISYFPDTKTAARTSPTNIGLYLMSTLNAFDFGLIGSDELWRRLTETLSSVCKLEKYNGHLYNWYDIEKMQMLPPLYVSTVDSGNLAVSLLCVKNGIRHFGPLFETPVKLIDELLCGMDFSFLYSSRRRLFHIGYDAVHGKADPNFYDLYPSEMLTAYFYASAKGQIPTDAFAALGRIFSDSDKLPSMLSWSGSAFEYFMPSIWLGCEKMTERGEMLASAAVKQRDMSAEFEGARIYGVSESAYFDFDGEMNFSYKAHGVPSLAISHGSAEDRVFSPYSIYLMLGEDISAPNTLKKLKKTSLYGKYGFYDALDLTQRRVGKDGAVVEQYMAHHIGMSISAAANYCLDGINVKRFFDDPQMNASVHLLLNKNEICLPRSNAELHRPMTNYPFTEHREGEITDQGTVTVSNGLMRIDASDTGNIAFFSGEMLLTRRQDGDLCGFGVLLMTDGEIYDCLGFSGVGVRPSFSYDGGSVGFVKEIIHGDRVIKSEVVFTVDPKSSTALMSVDISGNTDTPQILVYAFPVLAKERDYKSAAAYSNLFLTQKQTDNGISFKRRAKLGEYTPVEFFFRDAVKLVTDIESAAAFPLGADSIKHLFDGQSNIREGAAVHPFVCAVFAGNRCEMRISQGENDGEDETFEDIREGAMRRFRLFSTYAGADTGAVLAAVRLLSFISDGNKKMSECADSTFPVYRRDILWRHGISGDLPIILFFADSVDESASRYAIDEVIRAKRFLFISGVRFDLVIVTDDGGYTGGDEGRLDRLLTDDGCERLKGRNNGVFLLGKSKLSENDVKIMLAVSAGVIGESGMGITRPRRSDMMLKRHPVRQSPRKAEFTDTGVRVFDGKSPVPWSYVYANSVFGTLLTNKTAGFSWYRNSSLGAVSSRHTDALTGTPGERLILETENGMFDLLMLSDEVKYGDGCALYRGEADSVRYEVKLGVDARLPVKLVHVRFETAPTSAKLGYHVYPDGRCIAKNGKILTLKEPSVIFEIFSLPSVGAMTEISAGCVSAVLPLSGKEAGFVMPVYPSVGSTVTEYAKYKYSSVEAILAGFCEYGERLNGLITLRQYTGDVMYLSDMLGISLRQAYLYRILARTGYYQSGGAYGFRDQLQDSLSALYFSPELTKYQILRSCAHQYTDGRVQHWWHPGVGGLKSRCSDDYMWLPYVTAEYVLSTGDFDILSLNVPYLVSLPLEEDEEDRYELPERTRERYTVIDHCLKAVETSHEIGVHGLPLMLSGDWNDGMNGIGQKGRGESVWLAFFFAVTYRKMAEMLRLYGNGHIKTANELDSFAEKLVFSAEKTWEGDRYLRAYDDDGEPVGSIHSDECKIDILPQAFSVFAKTDRERSVIAMESLYRELYDAENGILRLFSLPFENKTEYGYITRYPKGIRENGGQYTHAAVWAARAFFELGAYRRGMEILEALSPSVIYEKGRMNGCYTAEPYLIAADIYYGEGITGKSGWSGYTGSAAWYYTTAVKECFGIAFYLGSLTVDPRPEYVTGNYELRFMYGGHSVFIKGEYSGGSSDYGGFDKMKVCKVGETVKLGKIVKDIKILLKIRN